MVIATSKLTEHPPLGRALTVIGAGSAAVAGLVAWAFGSIGAAGNQRADATGLLAAVTILLSGVVASVPVGIASRGGALRMGVAVFTGSLLRLLSVVAFGLLAQAVWAPGPASFWAGLMAGWLAAKLAEACLIWPRLHADPGPRSIDGRSGTGAPAGAAP